MAQPNKGPSQRKAQRNFPTWLIIAGVALLIAAVWALLNSGYDKAGIEVTGAPSIKVDQELFDYGEVKLGDKPIRTEVRVTNVGDQTLQFTEAPYIEVLEGC